MPRVTPPDTPPRDTLTRVMTPPGETPSDTSLETLRAQLAEAEKRAAIAEAELRGTRALIDEKQRTIDAQAHALRLLEPPQRSTPPPPPEPDTNPWVVAGEGVRNAAATPQPNPLQRPWWSRLFGS